MTDAIEPLKELARRWREEAQRAVPPEYADRQLHGKYLSLDNAAAGMDLCADELESLLPAMEKHLNASQKLKECAFDALTSTQSLMACSHPKACWVESVGVVEPLRGHVIATTDAYCTACEHERLAVAAALREAAGDVRRIGNTRDGSFQDATNAIEARIPPADAGQPVDVEIPDGSVTAVSQGSIDAALLAGPLISMEEVFAEDELPTSKAALDAHDAEVRDRALEEACATICVNCSTKTPLSDGKNGMHLGGLHCYAWPIRALRGSK